MINQILTLKYHIKNKMIEIIFFANSKNIWSTNIKLQRDSHVKIFCNSAGGSTCYSVYHGDTLAIKQPHIQSCTQPNGEVKNALGWLFFIISINYCVPKRKCKENIPILSWIEGLLNIWLAFNGFCMQIDETWWRECPKSRQEMNILEIFRSKSST